MTRRSAVFLSLALALTLPSVSRAMETVPPGNRHAEQPDIPGGSSKRTAAMKTTFEGKYQKVLALLRNDS